MDKKRLEVLKKELEKWGGILPTPQCLNPEEIQFLSSARSDHSMIISSKELCDRIHHALSCDFCLPLATLALGLVNPPK